MHPDKLDESLTQEDRDKAYEKFLAIDKAWKLLKNQETRVNLDKQLKGKMFLYIIFFQFFLHLSRVLTSHSRFVFFAKKNITKSLQLFLNPERTWERHHGVLENFPLMTRRDSQN